MNIGVSRNRFCDFLADPGCRNFSRSYTNIRRSRYYKKRGAPLWPVRSGGCLSVLHFLLNHLFCGVWLPAEQVGNGRKQFARIGNSCSEELRVLAMLQSQVRKRVFLRCHFILKMIIILPRQARDKHRESTQKRVMVVSERGVAAVA